MRVHKLVSQRFCISPINCFGIVNDSRNTQRFLAKAYSAVQENVVMYDERTRNTSEKQVFFNLINANISIVVCQDF